ncbi:uracil-DNA glycosylase [Bacteroidota bacterium]
MEKEFNLFKKEVLRCTECSLCKTRNSVVFGEGNPYAEIFVIGEGPGHDEDIQGRPFVGRSGQLLRKIFEVCGFSYEEHLFIGNIVKCRPPNNRVPSPAEKDKCLPYLLKQISMINPKILIILGSTALNTLVDPEARISRVRGKWIRWRNFYVMPTYHPSALLRNSNLKKHVWEDFKEVVMKYRKIVDPFHYSSHC